MHSSEMRTARSLPYKGSLSGWGSLSGGVSVRGSLSRGVFSGGLCLEGLCPGEPLDRDPSEEHGTRDRDLLKGTWDQAAR